MTLEEAKQKAREGHKVRHRHFTFNEYMEFKVNEFYFEDGVKIPDWWWHDRWKQDGWALYEES